MVFALTLVLLAAVARVAMMISGHLKTKGKTTEWFLPRQYTARDFYLYIAKRINQGLSQFAW